MRSVRVGKSLTWVGVGFLLFFILSDRAVCAGTFETIRLRHEGYKRKYVVYIPSSYDGSRPVPVVLNFHGGGGDSESAWEISGMNEKADRAGFLAVYPQGRGKRFFFKVFGTWNAGRCCAFAQKKNIDDVDFVRVVIADLKERFRVDARRIFATGLSNGALITYRLACDLAEEIAAVAPVAAHDTLNHCQAKRPVSVLHFHGTADPTALFQGGRCGTFLMKKEGGWACRSVPDYVEEWRVRNGCSAQGRVTYRNGAAICTVYGSCKEDGEVGLCTVEGGGHNWPGGRVDHLPAMIRKKLEPLSMDISATDMMWEFFQKHPLPAQETNHQRE